MSRRDDERDAGSSTRSLSSTVRVPIQLLAALVLGGGGVAGAQRLFEQPQAAAPAQPPTIDVVPIYRRLDALDERMRALETAAARTDAGFSGITRSLDRLEKKLDEAPTRRR